MLIDTHSHLNFRAFDKDRDEVVKKCLGQGVWMINVGSNYETSKKAVEMAEQYGEGVYAAVGLHPINLDTGLVKLKTDEAEGRHLEASFDYEKYKELAQSPKVVAIGEIGLDYWYKPKTAKKTAEFKKKQKELLLRQLGLARELGLPVIFHCRSAHNDLLQALELQVTRLQRLRPARQPDVSRGGGRSRCGQAGYKLQAVVHCFTGTWPQAQQYLAMGLYLGFNGIIFKLPLDEVVLKTPLERILVETDCPYLTPPVLTPPALPASPQAGQVAAARNEPANVKYVVQKIAELKKTTFDRVSQAVNHNARTLFRL